MREPKYITKYEYRGRIEVSKSNERAKIHQNTSIVHSLHFRCSLVLSSPLLQLLRLLCLLQLLTLLCLTLTLPLWHLNPKREALTLTPEENRAEAARPALAARSGVVAAAAVAELEVSTAAASAPQSPLPLKVASVVSVRKASGR